MLALMIWAVLVGFLLVLLTLPIGLSAQSAFGLCSLLILFVAYQIGPHRIIRQLFLAFCMAVIFKYISWRITNTLPSTDFPIDFFAAIVVLGAELYCIVMLFMSVFVMIDPMRSRETPRLPSHLPTVDVFVPSYNEDVELVAHTLHAAKAMTYHPERMTVWLLDDGGTDQKCESDDPNVSEAAIERRAALQALCAELGVRYLTRARNVMAKAGNLNNGLAHSTGELVVVFDADHAPMNNFLLETVGHFTEDPRLFLVQTPHVFLNPDPIERNLGIDGYAPSENEMFYGQIQRGLDSWNSSFFCGSAAVLRRVALEEVGGFSGRSITEDCESALELHARGWNSRFVDKPMIRGLQPEMFASLIGQRSRWCRGMLQIFLLKNPWLTSGLSMSQRICYSSSCLFWFFPIVRGIFLVAPLLYLVFDMKIYSSSAQEFVVYTIPYLIAAILMQGFLFGKYRWAWLSEIYEYVQSVYLFGAVINVLLNPKKPTFNVTEKGATLNQSRLSSLAWPYFLIFAILAATTAYAVHRYGAEPSSRTLLLVVGGWNVFNLVLAAIALGAVSERREQRARPRLAVNRPAELVVGDERVRAVIQDVSQSGLRIRPSRRGALPFALDKSAVVRVLRGNQEALEVSVAIANRTSVAEEPSYGVAFDRTDPRRFAVVHELMYAGSAIETLRPENERKARNLLVWTGELVARSAHQLTRGLAFALFRRRGAAAGARS